MEPVVLVCEGCGARIRSTDPDRARGRDCPRCSAPLASAVARSPGPEAVAAPPAPEEDAWRDLSRNSPRRLGIAAGAIVATIAAVASLALRELPEATPSPRPRAESPRPADATRPTIAPEQPGDRAEVAIAAEPEAGSESTR